MRSGVELEKSNHYSPLPQVLSDDDDDDDDELKNSLQPRKAFNEKINFSAINDEVMKNGMSTPLIAASMHEPKKMSLSRTVCFSLSVLLSCIAVMSFLWLLPCDVGLAACKSSKNCDTNSDWQIQFPSTAFSSGLQLVDADQDGRMDIIVGFHPVSSNGSFTDTPPSFSAGLIVIRGFDGQKIWRQTYYSTPSDILCNVLDVNQDGVLDCILIGNRGLFSAINISNDYTFWYLHDHMSGRRPVNMSLPATVPDLTDDEIDDLIVSCHLTEVTKVDEKLISPLAFLIIISGGMGELWGNPVQLRGCVLASKPVTVTINKIIYIFVHCEPDSGLGSVLMLSLSQLKEDALDNCSDFNSNSDEIVCSNRTETEITSIHIEISNFFIGSTRRRKYSSVFT